MKFVFKPFKLFADNKRCQMLGRVRQFDPDIITKGQSRIIQPKQNTARTISGTGIVRIYFQNIFKLRNLFILS